MKKLNNAGFTLIELLAVITIMGILMMVAIPSVTRTIENSRRDTFADIAGSYISAVRNSVLSDELVCDNTNVSATANGSYYILLSTGDVEGKAYVKTQTIDLMESGGTSSWGGADVAGYVVWSKESVKTSAADDADSSNKITYAIVLTDTGKHGIATLTSETSLSRSKVSASGAEYTSGTAPTTYVAYADRKSSTPSSENTPVECKLK